MSVPLHNSYRYCTRLARAQARNFYYSFLPLPPHKRAAMCAIYAFMRGADDIADAAGGGRAQRLQEWREALERALRGDYGESALLPAFHHAVEQFGIPPGYFHLLIDGAAMDLEPTAYITFADTYRYCYHVAAVVGLVCVHVFGFAEEDTAEVTRLAEYNGIAFQLTNILRDLREDAQAGRCYLPGEELARFGYSRDDLREGVDCEAFRALMRFQVERARQYYLRAAPLVEMIHADSRPCLRAMRSIYGGILDEIVARNYDVFTRRARVPGWRKLLIAGSACLEAWHLQRGPAGKAPEKPLSSA
jgi:phytoene synthase